MSKIVFRNAKEEGQTRRGWFIGAFIDSDSLQKNSDVEIKWGIHPKGEKRESQAGEGNATTVSILIKGKFQINFSEKTIVLEKEGDYAMWNPNQPHHTESFEDSVILTVRWPSLSEKKN